MGSTTYAWILRNLVHSGSAAPNPWPYEQPAWVFSFRPQTAIEGADIRFVRGDVRPVHREMAAAADGKNIWILGGGELAGLFYDRGLLDELIVQVTPVTLGRGAPLLPREITAPALRLLSIRMSIDTFVEVRYEVPHRCTQRRRPAVRAPLSRIQQRASRILHLPAKVAAESPLGGTAVLCRRAA